ncbi:MAG: hypothetical protein PHX43_07460 [Alphaproteobacteria bacterium]|nr:hypothetical protein [Alphaproteobacteria bacterium]
MTTFVCVVLSPDRASAQTFGNIFCNISQNLTPYTDFISWIAYIVGIFLVASGVMMTKRHAENPNDPALSRCVLRMVGGAGSISLPALAGIIQNSVIGTVSINGAGSCSAGPVTSDVSSPDQLFSNLFDNIGKPMQTSLSVLCFVMGAFLVFRGLLRASKYGTDAKASPASIGANLIIGAILLSVGQMINIGVMTMFGDPGITPFAGINWEKLAPDGGEGFEKINKVVASIITFVQVIGMIAFIRGWLILKSVVEGSGQATMAQGITHIMGGVLAINIGTVADIADKTFGLNIVGG